jgi:hypothetical protein
VTERETERQRDREAVGFTLLYEWVRAEAEKAGGEGRTKTGGKDGEKRSNSE